MFVNNINTARDALNQQIEILQQKADNVIEPLKKFEAYPDLRNYQWSAYTTNQFGSHDLRLDCYFQNKNSLWHLDIDYTGERVKTAIVHYWKTYEQWKEDCEPILEKNKAIKEHNELQAKRLETFMKTLGINETYTTMEYKTKRSKNPTQVKNIAGWKQDLNRIMPKDNYDALCKKIEDKGKSIEKYGWDQNKKYEEEKAHKEMEQKEQEVQRNLAFLAAKYTNDPKSDALDILDEIMSKNKYLMLAHYLHKNRQDWSNGYDYAEIGLFQFTIETDQDEAIHDELNTIIEDGKEEDDIDGRMFRDCEWNYDILYGLVDDEELMKDYRMAISLTDPWW